MAARGHITGTGNTRRSLALAISVAGTLLLAVAAPGAALAQGPSTVAYAETGGNVLPAAAETAVSSQIEGGASHAVAAARAGGDPAAPTARAAAPGAQAAAPGARPAAPSAAPTVRPVAGPPAADDPATLPVTGADAGLAALAGLTLLGLGLLLRRTQRPGVGTPRRQTPGGSRCPSL